MEDKTAFDIVIEFLKKNSFDFETSRQYKRFSLIPTDPSFSKKFIVSQIQKDAKH